MKNKIRIILITIFLGTINCKSLIENVSVNPVENLSKKYYFINYINFEHLMMTSSGHRITIKGAFQESDFNILLRVDSVINSKNMILLSVKEDNFIYFHENKDTIRYNSDMSEYYFRNMIFKHYSRKSKLPPDNLELYRYFTLSKRKMQYRDKKKRKDSMEQKVIYLRHTTIPASSGSLPPTTHK